MTQAEILLTDARPALEMLLKALRTPDGASTVRRLVARIDEISLSHGWARFEQRRPPYPASNRPEPYAVLPGPRIAWWDGSRFVEQVTVRDGGTATRAVLDATYWQELPRAPEQKRRAAVSVIDATEEYGKVTELAG